MDDRELKFATKKFCEGGAVAVMIARRWQAERQKKQQELIARIEERERAKAEAENVVEEEIEEPL